MKQFLFFLSLILLVTAGQAQMNIGSSQAPQSSAMLQVSGTTRGFLPPRMSRDSMYLIANPATGLLVYNTTDSLIFMRRDTGWVGLAASDQLWQKNGANIYNNNTGFVGIGTNTPSTLLHVEGANPLTLLGVADGTTTTSDSVLTINNGLVMKIPLSSLAIVSNGITTADAPLTYSNGEIGITQASTTSDGYLSAGDYNIFNNKVNSIALTANVLYPTTSFTVTGGAATATLPLNTQGSNKVFAGPVSGGNVAPSFRALVAADLPKATSSLVGGVSVGSGLSVNGLGVLSVTNPSSGGTVTSVSVSSANGLAGTVATATTTPAITLSTTVTGMVKGNGTALSTATSGTDYAPGTAGNSTGIVKSTNGTGALTTATSGTDYAPGTAANTTGIVKSTNGTGALTTATASDFPTLNQSTTGTASNITGVLNATSFPALTGDVTTTAGTVATTIASGAVTNAKLSNMATQTFKGRTTAGTGSPEDLTATQATAILNTFTSTIKGLVPSSGGGTANFLRADGTFAVPSGTNVGSVTSVSVTTANGVSGTVATATTTPAISLTLGDITPTSVAATGTVTGSNLSGSHSGTSSGTNTGDETNATIKTKLGPATTTNDGYLTATDWNTFNNKASTANVISSLNGLTATSQTFAIPGTTGTAPAWSSAGSIHTLNIPLASATGVTAGLLSNADWNTFNNKASITNSWSTTGNAGTNSVTNFLGTTDNNSLSFKTNNISRMHLDSAGGLFIGDSASSYGNTVNNTQAGFRSDWTTSLTSADIPRIALQGQMRANLTPSSGSAQIRGFNGSALVGVNNGVTSNADIYGGYFLARRQSATGITEGTGTLNILAGAGIEYGHTSSASSGGTTNNVYGIKLIPFYASGTITNLYGLYAGAPTTGGTVTNMYDIYLAAQSLTGVTNSWAIYQANTKNNYFGGNVGIGTTTPSTALHVVGTNPLTLTGVQTGTNTSADSLLTITNGLVRKLPLSTFGSSTNAWSTVGNSGTTSGTNFLGTTDNASFKFRTNNTQTMLLDSLGNAAIGSAPAQTSGNIEKLLVDAGTTNSFNVISGKGSINNYLQLNIQNRNAGGNASSDVVATADNGDESNNFVDLGINSSANNTNYFGAANDAYLYAQSQNMLIGTASANKSIAFLTGGGTQSTNERMRIDGNGNVGIGTNAPSYKLQVSSTANPLSLLGVQTGSNTDSIVTILNGVVRKLSPSALAIPSSNAWGLTGNTNTLSNNYFLGTTNSDPLIFKVNNQLTGRLDAVNTYLGYQSGNSNGTNANQSTGIGYHALFSNTSGTYNTAIGYGALQNNASGSNNIGVGNNAAVINNSSNSIAIGTNSNVNNSSSIAIGNTAQTNNTNAISIGNNTYTNGNYGIAIGSGPGNPKTQAYADYSMAFGYNAYAGGTNAISIGQATNSSQPNSISIGNASSATGANSVAIGYNAAAASDNTIVLGDKSNAAVSVAIGSENFSASPNREKLLVDATTIGSYNVISARGNLNNYLQLNVQNKNAGTSASSDLVATTDNGDENNNYVDLGINSSGNTSNLWGAAGDAYLYTQTNNMLIGTAGNSKVLAFLTGGGTQSTNERMRIDGTGKVGIGNIAPTEKLDITGNLKFSGAVMPNNVPGTLGQVLTSTGSNSAPVWATFSTTAPLSLNSGVIAITQANSTTNGYLSSTDWNTFNNKASNTNSWSTTGNAGTTSGSNFFGTTDNTSLKFRTNNTQMMLLDSLGNTAIGSAPAQTSGTNIEKFLVDAGTTNSFNVISGKGNINNYLQLNIQNRNAGGNASSDVVATADNGDESNNFVDLGINSSVNNTNYFGAANDAYLYAQSQNMLIGTASASKSIAFLTGGGTQSTNERMRITGTGRVGIGTNAPASDLTVYQSSGTGNSKGITFTGNSIGGANTGTGFLMTLGYNATSNKQLWLGDADDANNVNGTFARFSVGGNTATIDAVKGDNSQRRFLSIGVGADGASGAVFGGDGNSTHPGSYVWDNGNFTIGNGYRSNAAPANGLLVQGNVGVGTTSPTAILQLGAGTANANTAPLKLTSGTNLSTPEAGAVEFDGTNYYATSGTMRYTLAKTLTATASLTFNATAANTSSNATTTITFTGAVSGDVIILGIPSANGAAAGSYSAYVSANDTVSVKFTNNTTASVTPASGSFRVSILKY